MPSDSIKNIRELGMFFKADIKQFLWIKEILKKQHFKKIGGEDEK